MSYSQVISYTSLGDIVGDTNEIEIVSGKVQLKKIDKPSQTFTEDAANDTGWTYNSALAEFAAGVARQKDQTPANSVFGWQANDKDLNWRNVGASLIGTLNGSPTFSSSRMICTGSQGVNFLITSSAIETYFIDYIPSYSGAPPLNLNISGFKNDAGNNDRFALTHSPSGDNFRITLHDSSGTQIYLAAIIGASGVNLSAGTVYRFACVLNSTAGTVSLYRKSGAGAWVLHGTLSPGVWVRGSISGSVYLGADDDIYNQAEASYDNAWLFNAVQDPTSSDPGVPPFRKFLENKLTLPDFNYSGAGDIQALTNLTSVIVGTVGWIVEGQYWNGSAWTVSSGTFAQSNSIATIVTNLGSLNVVGQTVITIEAVFSDTNTQSSIDDIVLTYTGQEYPIESLIKSVSSFETDDILDLFETSSGVTGIADIKYIFYLNGSPFWISSGAFAPADDSNSLESNTLEEVKASVAGLLNGLGKTVVLGVWIISDSQNATPSLDENIIVYSGYGGIPSEPTIVHVSDNFRDILGAYATDITFKAYIKRAFTTGVGGVHILPSLVASDTPNPEGYAELELVKSVDGNGSPYFFVVEWTDEKGIGRSVTYKEVYVTVDSILSQITSQE